MLGPRVPEAKAKVDLQWVGVVLVECGVVVVRPSITLFHRAGPCRQGALGPSPSSRAMAWELCGRGKYGTIIIRWAPWAQGPMGPWMEFSFPGQPPEASESRLTSKLFEMNFQGSLKGT